MIHRCRLRTWQSFYGDEALAFIAETANLNPLVVNLPEYSKSVLDESI